MSFSVFQNIVAVAVKKFTEPNIKSISGSVVIITNHNHTIALCTDRLYVIEYCRSLLSIYGSNDDNNDKCLSYCN